MSDKIQKAKDVSAAFAKLAAAELQAMSDEQLGRYIQGVVETLEACQKEHARRAAGGKPIKVPSIGRA